MELTRSPNTGIIVIFQAGVVILLTSAPVWVSSDPLSAAGPDNRPIIIEGSENGHGGQEDNQYPLTDTKMSEKEAASEVPTPNVTSAILNWIDDWEAPEELKEMFPFYISGYDLEGSPVYVLEYGRWKMSEAFNTGTGGREHRRKIVTKYLDQSVVQMLRDGLANNSQGVGVILDWNGFSLLNFADPLAVDQALKQMASLAQLHQVLKYAFLINTNFVAENFLALARPFLGNILEKCEVYGPRKAKWAPQLLRKIARDQLPSWYGGEEDWRPVWVGGISRNVTEA